MLCGLADANYRRCLVLRLNKSRMEKEKNGQGDRKPANSFDALFDAEWEVFVIKRDKVTGKLVGKTACCALAKVD